MTLDVSEAIALAKDLLQTGHDFRAHDPALATAFSSRAYEICDDLGIDRALIGEPAEEPSDMSRSRDLAGGDDDVDEAGIETLPLDGGEEDTRQTSRQLRDLLQQQAMVLQNARVPDPVPEPKAEKRFFRLFGRQSDERTGVQFQSA